MGSSAGLLYLCLAAVAAAAALICVICAGSLRADASLWLAIAIVATVLYVHRIPAQLPSEGQRGATIEARKPI